VILKSGGFQNTHWPPRVLRPRPLRALGPTLPLTLRGLLLLLLLGLAHAPIAGTPALSIPR